MDQIILQQCPGNMFNKTNHQYLHDKYIIIFSVYLALMYFSNYTKLIYEVLKTCLIERSIQLFICMNLKLLCPLQKFDQQN